jgi:hypothetical protein
VATTVSVSEGAERVKAGAGVFETTSIAAPVTAAIALPERMRNFMVSSWSSETVKVEPTSHALVPWTRDFHTKPAHRAREGLKPGGRARGRTSLTIRAIWRKAALDQMISLRLRQLRHAIGMRPARMRCLGHRDCGGFGRGRPRDRRSEEIPEPRCAGRCVNRCRASVARRSLARASWATRLASMARMARRMARRSAGSMRGALGENVHGIMRDCWISCLNGDGLCKI